MKQDTKNRVMVTSLAVMGGMCVVLAGVLGTHASKVEDVAPVVTSVSEFPEELPLTGVIEEDDPRWDCRTMGNMVCGVEIAGQMYNIHFDYDGTIEGGYLQ